MSKTQTHPDLAEWRARHDNLPAGAKALFAKIAEQSEAERQRREAEAQARADAEKKHRADFEAAVAAELVAAGVEWLAGYRMPDEDVPGLPFFDGTTAVYYAWFDIGEECGVYPIGVKLRFIPIDKDGHRVWSVACHPWHAACPTNCDSYAKFIQAFAAATTFYSTPF